jgi:flagellar biosynthesis GTPase FlhF
MTIIRKGLIAFVMLAAVIGNAEAQLGLDCEKPELSPALNPYPPSRRPEVIRGIIRHCDALREAAQRKEEAHQRALQYESKRQQEKERQAEIEAQRQQEAHQQRLEAETRQQQQKAREAEIEAQRHEEWKRADAVRGEQERQRHQEELARQGERQQVELERYREEATRRAEQQRLERELADKKAEIDRQIPTPQSPVAPQQMAEEIAGIDPNNPPAWFTYGVAWSRFISALTDCPDIRIDDRLLLRLYEKMVVAGVSKDDPNVTRAVEFEEKRIKIAKAANDRAVIASVCQSVGNMIQLLNRY